MQGVRVDVQYDDLGHILDIDFVEDDSMAQSSIQFLIDDVIEHAGVKGMKWGVRKKPASSKGKAKPTKSKPSAQKSDKVSKMSDKELREAVTRMNLEKQYRDLSNPTKKSGENAVKKILKDSGKQIATKEVTRIGAALVSKYIAPKINKALNI